MTRAFSGRIVAISSARERQYEAIYREHAARLLRLARLFLRDPEEAKDIVQEVFAKAALALRGAEAPRDWRSWLTQVALNACRSRARKGWWRRLRRQGEPLEGRDFPDEGARPDAAAAGREARERVWRAFRELPERQQEVFALRHLQGYSTAEVAVALQLSEGAVKTHLFRAVHRLRQALEE